jgi:hypothetical protein
LDNSRLGGYRSGAIHVLVLLAVLKMPSTARVKPLNYRAFLLQFFRLFEKLTTSDAAFSLMQRFIRTPSKAVQDAYNNALLERRECDVISLPNMDLTQYTCRPMALQIADAAGQQNLGHGVSYGTVRRTRELISQAIDGLGKRENIFKAGNDMRPVQAFLHHCTSLHTMGIALRYIPPKSFANPAAQQAFSHVAMASTKHFLIKADDLLGAPLASCCLYPTTIYTPITGSWPIDCMEAAGDRRLTFILSK